MNIELSEIENESETKVWLRNGFLSILLHFILFIALVFIYKTNQSNAKVNTGFLYLETKTFNENHDPLEERLIKEESDPLEKNIPDPKPEEKSMQFVNLSNLEADTTNLDQVYKESTLNLSIKYPRGWTFIDQNRHNKLDGVTFWAADVAYNPPPYIHLEVVEKYLFNEKRYKYKIKLNDCVGFYNDPEEISNQVTQVFYLRTDSDEDYKIKLIINGKQNFDSFQAKFLAILKSFSFGNTLF